MNTEQKHTPELDPLNDGDWYMNDDQIDALKGLVNEVSEQRDELAEALRETLCVFEPYTHDDVAGREWMVKARAALAKL